MAAAPESKDYTMIMPTAALATFALALQAAPAVDDAQDAIAVAETAGIDESQSVEDDESEDRLICRRTAIIGSKFKKRICATADEWETLSRQGQDTTKEFQRRGKGNEPVN